jgi:hypothetical protein
MADDFSERYVDLLTGSYDCVDRIVLNAVPEHVRMNPPDPGTNAEPLEQRVRVTRGHPAAWVLGDIDEQQRVLARTADRCPQRVVTLEVTTRSRRSG